MNFLDNIVNLIVGNKFLTNLFWAIITIIIGYILADVLSKIVKRIFSYLEKKKKLCPKRVNTYAIIFAYAVKIIILFITAVQAFSFLGMKSTVNSLFATAGIGGIALSFGAQNLVRDIISGLFMLIENQYSVGDYIQLGSLSGKVEGFYPRTTIIRADTGELHTIPNGNITSATNYSRGNISTSIDVPFSTQTSPFFVTEIVQKNLSNEFPDDNIIVDGITKVTGSDYTLSCSFKSSFDHKSKKYKLILSKIIECFAENHIKLPGGNVPLKD